MTTGKTQPSIECCMCGDYGLSSELFKCKVCQFRSQHRYCSNQYPKAESYGVCNWCLSQRDDSTEKTPNSSNSSSSNKNNSSEDRGHHVIKKKKKKINNGGGSANHGGLKGHTAAFHLQISSPIKKQRLPERSPAAAAAARKRPITGGGGRVEERLTRTKSEEVSNGGIITKQVFRNKVRRYKLLDEVSSQ